MAAATTVMHLVQPGDRVVAVNDVYGGTYRLFTKVYERRGVRFEFLDAETCNTELAAHLDADTRLVWIETPTNPLLNVIDIHAVAEAAHAAGALLVVDNTFASPYLQRPLELGADIVLHSTTKYLGGHSDLVGGFAASSNDEVAEQLKFLQNSLGAIPGPFDSWLVLRGLKTLAVRMRAHCENAAAVVEFLSGEPRVERGALSRAHRPPRHAIAARQMDGFGGMVSFLSATEDEAVALVARTRVWSLAESLGGVESLIEHPAQMTHASTADAPFATPRNLVRLSVGIEAVGRSDRRPRARAQLGRRARRRLGAGRSGSACCCSAMIAWRLRPNRAAHPSTHSSADTTASTMIRKSEVAIGGMTSPYPTVHLLNQ